MARYFGRAIVMPNLTPPITTVALAIAYRQRILLSMKNLPRQFDPLMVIYLTDNTNSADIELAMACEHVYAAKLYPAGATTNSDAGVTSIEGLYPVLEKMAECGMPLLIHGEVTDDDVDIYDREQVFIHRYLLPISERFRSLKIVLEHITTADAVQFVTSKGDNIAATITPHHLLYNRNDMLANGIRPHLFCLPILKRNTHQRALIEAATSGTGKFFLGTDSAPHDVSLKESNCGCAGCYSANLAIELYAEAFEEAGALDKLEGFASHYGPDFYGLPRNQDTITLVKQLHQVPDLLPLGKDHVSPLAAGEKIHWQVSNK
tara:strand:- start:464 stop:1420 length:957 start_codon:yes stop_codon:yes gene_type:complete